MAEVKIINSTQLTDLQQMFVLTAPSIKLNDIVQDKIILEVLGAAELEITTDDEVYTQYVILTTDGEKYTTGSSVLWGQLSAILENDLIKGRPVHINIYKQESKKHPGQKFLTCCVALV